MPAFSHAAGSLEPDRPSSSPERNRTLDLLKIAGILAVIFLHAHSFQKLPGWERINFLIDNAARFAVPCFFMIAGYFLHGRFSRKGSLRQVVPSYVLRLLFVFAAWSLVYFVFPKNIFYRLFTVPHELLDHIRGWMRFQRSWIEDYPWKLVMAGSEDHLWFLPGLACGVVVLSTGVALKKEKVFFLLSIGMFIFAMLCKSYAVSPAGIHLPASLNSRNGPFFSSLFVFLGWFTAAGAFEKIGNRQAFLLAAGGLALHLAEALMIWKVFGGLPGHHDFLAGTVPFSFGLFLLAVRNPGLVRSPLVSRLASLTLGIYVFHRMVLVSLLDAGYPVTAAAEAALPWIVYVLSAAFIAVLKKIPVIEKTVA